jgi:hypothetical protein
MFVGVAATAPATSIAPSPSAQNYAGQTSNNQSPQRSLRVNIDWIDGCFKRIIVTNIGFMLVVIHAGAPHTRTLTRIQVEPRVARLILAIPPRLEPITLHTCSRQSSIKSRSCPNQVARSATAMTTCLVPEDDPTLHLRHLRSASHPKETIPTEMMSSIQFLPASPLHHRLPIPG